MPRTTQAGYSRKGSSCWLKRPDECLSRRVAYQGREENANSLIYTLKKVEIATQSALK